MYVTRVILKIYERRYKVNYLFPVTAITTLRVLLADFNIETKRTDMNLYNQIVLYLLHVFTFQQAGN